MLRLTWSVPGRRADDRGSGPALTDDAPRDGATTTDGNDMGFFTKPDAAPTASAPQPLTHQRVTDCMDARGLHYGVDDEGDIGGYWDGHLFYFLRMGQSEEYLQVRGRWNRVVAGDQLARVMALVNQWNADRLWPKGYVRPEGGDGQPEVVGVYAEHTVDYEHGLTDEQLDQHLACGISTALQLFEHLDEAYPAEAATAKAAQETNE